MKGKENNKKNIWQYEWGERGGCFAEGEEVWVDEKLQPVGGACLESPCCMFMTVCV
jgi:hypothetical protein